MKQLSSRCLLGHLFFSMETQKETPHSIVYILLHIMTVDTYRT